MTQHILKQISTSSFCGESRIAVVFILPFPFLTTYGVEILKF